MAVAGLRVLVPGDEAQLFAFLEPHVDTSLCFFSNVERAGLVDTGAPFTGSHVASHDGEGRFTAVAYHLWNNTVGVQGNVGIEDAASFECHACWP